MNLASIRIITANINDLIKFYECVTETQLIRYTPEFAELHSKSATLAIGSTKTLQAFGGKKVAEAAHNQSAIIEFRVEDVEKDYERLADYLKNDIVQKPTTLPWGNKSFLFRDPDGNLVNLFTPVTKEAIKKFDGETN